MGVCLSSQWCDSIVSSKQQCLFQYMFIPLNQLELDPNYPMDGINSSLSIAAGCFFLYSGDD